MNPIAAVAAWAWPGLGHIVRGQPRRGGLIMAGMLFLIITGLLVGGLDCVDRRRDRLWFLAQSLCGPLVFVADWTNQNYLKTYNEEEIRRGFVQQDPGVLANLDTIGLARVNEMGTLFVALAGLMNLIVILDCLENRTRPHQATTPARRSTDA
ncbi:MAG: DUF6677 family protein [Planctomycetota bacterium]|jgi:hypothetical protein